MSLETCFRNISTEFEVGMILKNERFSPYTPPMEKTKLNKNSLTFIYFIYKGWGMLLSFLGINSLGVLLIKVRMLKAEENNAIYSGELRL